METFDSKEQAIAEYARIVEAMAAGIVPTWYLEERYIECVLYLGIHSPQTPVVRH